MKAMTLPIKFPSVSCRYPSLIAQLRHDGRRQQWQAPPPGILPPPLAFLSLLLFKLELELLLTPLHPQHTTTRARAPIPPPPKHHCLCISPSPDVVGEVHRRPIFSFPERDRIPHVTLVVQGKPSPGSRSVWSLGPRPPERRPSRRRRRTPSLPPFLRP
jgi:hypothetical protein